MSDQELESNQSSLEDLSNFITFRISRASASLNKQAMKTLAHLTDLGLTQWRILAVIHMEGQTVAAKVARYADLDKGQISRAVNTLKDMGFVQEGDDPNDGRSAMLSLTEAGHAEYDHVVQTMRKRQKMLVQDVTAEDLETFRAVLKKIEARAQESIL